MSEKLKEFESFDGGRFVDLTVVVDSMIAHAKAPSSALPNLFSAWEGISYLKSCLFPNILNC